jgi:hypothetical protein
MNLDAFHSNRNHRPYFDTNVKYLGAIGRRKSLQAGIQKTAPEELAFRMLRIQDLRRITPTIILCQ